MFWGSGVPACSMDDGVDSGTRASPARSRSRSPRSIIDVESDAAHRVQAIGGATRACFAALFIELQETRNELDFTREHLHRAQRRLLDAEHWMKELTQIQQTTPPPRQPKSPTDGSPTAAGSQSTVPQKE